MTPIAPHITAFLRERLTEEHTRATYAYAFQLLFAFASRRLGVAPRDGRGRSLSSRVHNVRYFSVELNRCAVGPEASIWASWQPSLRVLFVPSD
jgi:hypothetical protein